MTERIDPRVNHNGGLAGAALRFARAHTLLSCLCMLVGMPVLTLAALFGLVSAVMLPFAFLCGWL